MKNNKQLLRTFFNKEKCFEKFLKNFNNEEQINVRKRVFRNNQSIYNLKDFINDYANGSLYFMDRKVSMESFFSHSFIWNKTVEGGKYWLEIGTKWIKFIKNV